MFITAILFLTACSDNDATYSVKSTSPSEGENKEGVLSYKEFENLFEKLSDEVEIEGYIYKDSSDGEDAIRIDEDLSFGKRKWLTKDGESLTEPTQEMFFYENEESTRLLTITLAYTENFIGNDMLFYNISSEHDINDELSNNEIIALSYKNIVINIMQTTSTDIEMEDTQKAAESIIKYLEAY
ncbi:hypothetical protein GCM10008924_02620 [Gracilibacillus halotolerans]|nr:hypothetical protein [Gracilibacillus halotolerans]